MSRLLVIVEGQTEESFVNNVLGPELYPRGFKAISARIMGNARQRSRRGGVKPWPSVREELLRHLREDKHVFVTTMVDFYGLPGSGDGAWPARTSAQALDVHEVARAIEGEVGLEIRTAMGGSFNPARFIPFVVLHEFEALLFSDCSAFAAGIGRRDLKQKLQQIRHAFRTPEDIDDSPETHPSKRIQELFPGYEKPLHGTLASSRIGIGKIRDACPHFHDWIDRLERSIASA